MFCFLIKLAIVIATDWIVDISLSDGFDSPFSLRSPFHEWIPPCRERGCRQGRVRMDTTLQRARASRVAVAHPGPRADMRTTIASAQTLRRVESGTALLL